MPTISDYSGILSNIATGARAQAVGSLDANPDQAARAVDLSAPTGIPAAAIFNKLDDVEFNHKAALTGQIIGNNPHLQDYVNSDPMAAKVSNDDWGQLDAVSQAMDKQTDQSPLKTFAVNWLKSMLTYALPQSKVEERMRHAFSTGFDQQGLEEQHQQDVADYADAVPPVKALGADLGLLSFGATAASHLISGTTMAALAGVGQLYANVTGDQISGDSMTRDLNAWAQVLPLSLGISGAVPRVGIDVPSELQDIAKAAPSYVKPPPVAGQIPELTIHPEIHAAAQEIAQATQHIAPYMMKGEVPPVGLDPLIDKIHAVQAEQDADAFKETLDESAKSATLNRSVDFFQKFANIKTKDATVGIPVEAVQKLYGNKVPAPDDNLLGFVPDLHSQMLRAAVTGGDIHVPMDALQAHPDVAKELIDSLRLRPEGMTVEEAKAAPKEASAAEPTPETPPETIQEMTHRVAGVPSITELARSAAGMPKALAAKLEKAIAAQQEALTNAAMRRAEESERRRQAPVWKANRKEILAQVTHEVGQDPTFLADRAMRENTGPKIGAEFLTNDEKALLPRSAWKQDSLWTPDDLANLYGSETGEALVKNLTSLEAERQGLGLSPNQHFVKTVNDETDSRMEMAHGDLQQNILDDAKELTLSPTTLDVLHAEIEGLAGGKLPKTKYEMESAAIDNVNNQKLGTISSADKEATAKRATDKVEKGLLTNDPTEALQQKQKNYKALLEAKQARKIEKVKKRFDKTVKKYRQANVPGARSEYTNHIHSIMVRLGLPVNRSLQGIAQAIADSPHTNLKSFVEDKEGDFGNQLLDVPEFLLNENFSVKSINDLTGGQFLDVAQAIRSMAHASEEDSKVIKGGEKVDINDIQATIREKANKVRPEQRPTEKSLPVEVVRKGLWSMLTPEALWDRLDLNDPNGIFNQVLNRITVEGVNHEDQLLKEYGRRLSKFMRGAGRLSKRVSNGLFYDQNTGEELKLTRGGVLGILQHYGDPWAWKVLTKGYGVTHEAAEAWLFGKINDEDLARAKGIGDLQTEIYDMYRNMARNVSDREYDKELPAQITMPNGEVLDGWHHPLRHDPIGDAGAANRQKIELEDKGYFRPERPANGFTSRRTNYIGQVALDLNVVPIRMKQMIHATATQPAAIQLAKFINNPKFMQMIEYSQGKGQADMLRMFLHDFVHAPEFRTASSNLVMRGISTVINNFVGSAVALSPTTWAKHGGTAFVKSVAMHPIGFSKELVSLFTTDPATREMNIKLAMNKSDELGRKWVSLTERAYGAQDLISLRTRPSWTNIMQWGGSAPLTFFDMMSSIPLFLTVYKDALAKGADEGLAKYLGDKAVRQTHGSSAISNRPQALRSHNAVANAFTRFYGFYNENFQNLYKAGWQVNDSAKAIKVGDWATASKNLSAAAMGMFTAGIVPSLMEYATTANAPGSNERESWERFGINLLTNAPFASTIGLRDILPAIINREPQTGVAGSIIQDIADPINDLIPDRHGNIRAMTPAKQGQVLKDFILLSSLLTPVRTNMTEANAAEFLWNYYHGREHPRGPWETAIGLRRGTLKGPHSKSFMDWLSKSMPQ